MIISEAKQHLNPNGLIAVEHGFDQSDAVVALMKLAGLSNIQTHLDLAGHYRVASGRK
jgi:release factor glutamine methyltransferase